MILDANAANTKQLSGLEKLTGLLRNRPQDIGHRPFSSSPGPLYQSEVRCSAFRHLHISHNAPYLPPPPEKKFCISIVFNFSWGAVIPRRNEKQRLCKFWGANKVHHQWRMEMIFHSHANKSHFHKKGCALGLILKVRVFRTRKWPINLNINMRSTDRHSFGHQQH